MHSRMRKLYGAGALVACGLLVSGCAGYDVELKGGVFDYLGVSEIGKKKAEPKMQQRTGIVVPPSTAALPVPGSRPASQQVATASGQQWPVNPEDAKEGQKQALLQQHKEFCAVQIRKYEAKLIPQMADGPLGSCHPSVLKNFGITSDQIFGNKPRQQAAQ